MVKKHRHKGKYRSRTPKGYIVYKRRPNHGVKLIKSHRKLFQNLDKEKFEVGGYMDFNRKGLERADLYPGTSSYVEFDVSLDEEVQYHTHPKDEDRQLNRENHFPSKWDIEVLKDFPTQSMIIFHDDKAMIATKTKSFKIDKKVLNKLYNELSRDSKSMNVESLFIKYRPRYKKIGIDLEYIKHNKGFRIPVNVIEPRR